MPLSDTHLPENQDLVGRPQVLQLVRDQDATLVLQQSAHAPVASGDTHTHTNTGIRTELDKPCGSHSVCGPPGSRVAERHAARS